MSGDTTRDRLRKAKYGDIADIDAALQYTAIVKAARALLALCDDLWLYDGEPTSPEVDALRALLPTDEDPTDGR